MKFTEKQIKGQSKTELSNTRRRELTMLNACSVPKNQIWFIHTMEYYSAMTRNEVLTHGTTQMNLENITISVVK